MNYSNSVIFLWKNALAEKLLSFSHLLIKISNSFFNILNSFSCIIILNLSPNCVLFFNSQIKLQTHLIYKLNLLRNYCTCRKLKIYSRYLVKYELLSAPMGTESHIRKLNRLNKS